MLEEADSEGSSGPALKMSSQHTCSDSSAGHSRRIRAESTEEMPHSEVGNSRWETKNAFYSPFKVPHFT